MQESLVRMWESYREAWDALDAAAIASHYRVPCAITDGEGSQVLASDEALLAKFQRGCDAFRTLDFSGCTHRVVMHYPLGREAAAVDLDWRAQVKDGPLVFCTLYVCHRTADGWRIHAAHAYSRET